MDKQKTPMTSLSFHPINERTGMAQVELLESIGDDGRPRKLVSIKSGKWRMFLAPTLAAKVAEAILDALEGPALPPSRTQAAPGGQDEAE